MLCCKYLMRCLPALTGHSIIAGVPAAISIAVAILLLVDFLLLLVMVVVPFFCALSRLDSPAAISACFLELSKGHGWYV